MAGYIGSKASVVSSGAEHKKVFDITTTTTSLTGLVYTPTLVHVFHNGVRLVDGTDYTATSGTTITLTVAAENGDQVVVISYATFQTSDTVSASAGGTFGNNVSVTGTLAATAVTGDGSGLTSLTSANLTGTVTVSGANVGIGTASPAHLVDAISTTGSAAARFGTTYNIGSNDGTVIISNGGSGDAMLRFDYEGSNTDRARIGVTASNQHLQFFTAGNNERMRIDSSGNVGIGNSTPSSFNGGANNLVVGSGSGSEGITIYADNASNSAIFFADTDSTTTGQLNYQHASNAMSFHTNGGTERMRIDSSGAVLVAKTAQNSTAVGVQLNQTGTIIGTVDGGACLLLNRKSTTGTIIEFQYNNAGVGSVSVTGSSTAYNTSSDYRLKEDWQLMSGASERVLALKPVNFAWKVNGSRVDGFLAHEVAEIVPEAISGTKDAMRDEQYEATAAIEATYDEDGNELTAAVPAVMGTRSVPDMQGIDQSKLVPLLTAALQEALTKIADMEIRLSALEG